jgi:peptide/nickel transport system permease protein
MTTLLNRQPAWTGQTAAGRPVLPAPRRRARRDSPLSRILRSIARGLGIAVPVLFLTSFTTFLLGVFAKQKPAELLLGESATLADVARLNQELGLDQPVITRYLTWIGRALQGDLGTSYFTGIPVVDSIVQRLPVSLSIATFALLIAIVLGFTFGTLAAVKQGSVLDRIVTLVSATIATLPPFVLAIALIVIFGVLLPILPTGGYVDPAFSIPLWLKSMILPAVALSLDAASDVARQLRTGLVGTLDESYIVGARLRGLSGRRILFVHALRNGAGPAVATLGLQVPRLIGGAVIAEAIFSLPGLGQLARDGAMRGDVPVVIGTLMVTVAIVLVSSLAVNVVLAALRPEVRR